MNLKIQKCAQCKKYNGKRFCLRLNKHICWHCCNDLRIDLKCPAECEYSQRDLPENKNIKDEHKNLVQNYKTDSKAEVMDYLEKSYKIYLSKENPIFNKQIPMILKESSEGKKLLIDKFSELNLHIAIIPIFEKLLKIKGIKTKYADTVDVFTQKTAEDIAVEFITYLAEQQWDRVTDYFKDIEDNYLKNPKTVELIISKLKDLKLIKNLNYFDVLSSGLATDIRSAFCTFEINYKDYLTVFLINTASKENPYWAIDSIIIGEVNLAFSEADSLAFIASALSKEEYDKAFQLIKQLENIYFLSPDLYYYKGLYFSMKGENEKALKAFEEAGILDINFAEAYYNQAFIHHSEKQLDKAKELYNKCLDLQKNNVNALNNLGTICLYEKEYDKAEEYFKKCLSISPKFKYAQDNLDRIKLFIENDKKDK
ncbi:MAG: tetratricopeptide repeat protein [Candidatus Cloacimonetes bacterium]|jgi:hypothetical protein|nr:tetratricopeptide repeat protein [Candidatus Cloacimonadota bacterium]